VTTWITRASDQRVLGALASGPRTIQALQEELGLSDKVVGGALDQLKLASKVARHGLGKKGDPYTYSLPPGDEVQGPE
jgi:hypothetical protein